MARNPLGIIALFISLIYAMSTALLAFAIEKLEPQNQTVLIWFVALFPFATLLSFVWLVAYHHKKLYAPFDYRTDDGFHYADSQPNEIAARLKKEAASISQDRATSHDEALTSQTDDEISTSDPAAIAAATMQSRIGRSLILETLVFMELQRKYAATVRRNIAVGSSTMPSKIELDGILESPNGSYVVEVFTYRRSDVAAGRILPRVNRLEAARDVLARLDGRKPHSLICVIVQDRDLAEAQAAIEQQIRGHFDPPNIEYFEANELLTKYGLH